MSEQRIDESRLINSWMHSHEEDTETIRVYRPASYPFPPARGRSGFELRPGGAMIARRPGPTDRVETADGTWHLNGRSLQVSSADGGSQTMQIVSIDHDRLVVKKPT